MTEARSRAQVIDHLRSWLSQRRGIEPSQIGEETDLIEGRVLDSLQLVDFILLIEQLSGREVLHEGLDPARLRTLGRVFHHYFEPANG